MDTVCPWSSAPRPWPAPRCSASGCLPSWRNDRTLVIEGRPSMEGRFDVGGLAVSPDQLLDAIGDTVIVTDNAGLIVSWNSAAEAMYGWSAVEVTGHPIVDVLTSESNPGQTAEIVRGLRAGARFDSEVEVTRRDGSRLAALLTCTPLLDDEGVPVAAIGVSRDVTQYRRTTEQLHRSQRRFRALIQGSGDLFAITDAEAVITFVDGPVHAQFGIDADALVGRSLFELVEPARPGTCPRAVGRAPGDHDADAGRGLLDSSRRRDLALLEPARQPSGRPHHRRDRRDGTRRHRPQAPRVRPSGNHRGQLRARARHQRSRPVERALQPGCERRHVPLGLDRAHRPHSRPRRPDGGLHRQRRRLHRRPRGPRRRRDLHAVPSSWPSRPGSSVSSKTWRRYPSRRRGAASRSTTAGAR